MLLPWSLLAPKADVGDLLVQGGALSMGQIMQRLLEGVQAELQAQERDLCAHLNAQAHLLLLEAHLDCLEGSGSGFEGPNVAGVDVSGKGKQAASATESPDDPVLSDSTVRGKRRLSAGDSLALSELTGVVFTGPNGVSGCQDEHCLLKRCSCCLNACFSRPLRLESPFFAANQLQLLA